MKIPDLNFVCIYVYLYISHIRALCTILKPEVVLAVAAQIVAR